MADVNVKKLSVKFEGDTTGLVTATKLATKGFNDTEKAVKSLQTQFDKFGEGTNANKQVEYVNNLKNAIEEAKKSLTQLKDIKTQLENEDSNNKLTSGYQKLIELIDSVEQKQKGYLEELNKINSDKIESTYAKIAKAISKANEDMEKISQNASILDKALSFNPSNVELLTLKQDVLNQELARSNAEVMTLSRYLKELERNGVEKNALGFIETTNAINEAKKRTEELRIETAEYQRALSGANALASDISARGNKLREALRLDPTNTQLVAQYLKVLQQEASQAQTSVENFVSAQNSLDNRRVEETAQQYVNITTGLVNAKQELKTINEEQEKYTQSAIRTRMTLESANQALQQIKDSETALKDAFNIDPTNTKKAVDYADWLNKSINKCNNQIAILNDLMRDMDSSGIDKMDKTYLSVQKTVNSLAKEVDYLTKEQKNMDKDVIAYNNALSKAKTTIANTERVGSALKKALELDPTNTKLQEQYTEFLSQAISECASSQSEFESVLKNLDISNVDILKGKYGEAREILNQLLELQNKYGKSVENIEPKGLSNITNELRIINQLSSKAYGDLANLDKSIFENAKAYETNIAQINKVVRDLTTETVDDLKQIATSTGVAFSGISEYATIGATLGIAQKDLSSFTKAMVDLQVASDEAISGEMGAASVARLLNVFDIGANYAENFGSAITYVGDQFAATADEILNTASNMGGLSAINNVAITDLIGLSAEMKNLGISTASGASAISKTFLNIETAVKTGSDALDEFAKASQMDAEEFASSWENGPMDTFLRFINGLSTQVFDEINNSVKENNNSLSKFSQVLGLTNEEFVKLWNKDSLKVFEDYKNKLEDLEESSESGSVTLSNLGLTGVRVAQTLLKLSGNGNVVKRAIDDANKAWDENTNLMLKANTMYETTEYKLNAAKEAISQAASSLGDVFLPLVKDIADIANGFAKSLSKWPDGLKKGTVGILALATGLTKAISSASSFALTMNMLNKGVGTATTTTSIFSTTLGTTGNLLGSVLPYAIGALGVALAGYGAYTAITSNETNKLNKKFEDLGKTANDLYNQNLVNVSKSLVNVTKEMPGTIERIYELSEAFGENYKVNDKNKEQYDELIEKLNWFNDTVGGDTGVIYHLDKQTGMIVDQKGEIADLEKAWEDYRLELQRNTALDSYGEIYDNAIKDIADATETAHNVRVDIINALMDYGIGRLEANEIADYYQGFKDLNDLSDETIKRIDQIKEGMKADYDTESNIFSMLSQLEIKQETVDRLDNIALAYEKLQTTDTSNIPEAIQAIKDYSSETQTSLEESYNNLHDIDQQIILLTDEMNAIGDTTSKQFQELSNKYDDLVKKREEMKVEQQALSDAIMLSGTEGEISADKILTAFTNTNKNIAEDFTSTVNGMNITLEDWLAQDRTMVIDVRYNYINGPEGDIETKSVYTPTRGGSGGFGNIVPNISIPKTLTYASGGYGSFELNTTINVNNNGNALTTVQARSFAREIVDMVNSKLGRRI